MPEFDWELVERNRIPFEERAMLAVARVQGAWDQKSKELLTSHSIVGNLGTDDEEVKGIEKALLTVASKAALAIVGDGSSAAMLLGHPINLSEKERGILVLIDFANENALEGLQDWKNSTVFAQEILHGKTLVQIEEGFKKKSENFGVLGGILRRFDVDRENRTQDFLDYVAELSGGSEATFLENKQNLETSLLESLQSELRSLPLFKLISISQQLNAETQTEDKITSTSIVSARELFKELIRPSAEEFLTSLS